MKSKYILLFILLINSLVCLAQSVTKTYQDESFILNENYVSGANHTYIASDYIKLQTGFDFASSGNVFIAKKEIINGSSIGDYSDFTSGEQSCLVGATEGSFAVNESGAATYTIPIKISPGTNGMQPALAITYNSMSGNGLFGIGFNVSGLSAITRSPTNYHNDGFLDPIDFDENDKFMLDGQRLMVVNGVDYGENLAEYRTEYESYQKIISYGGTDNDPDYFIVKTKSGLTKEYGRTVNSRIELLNSDNAIYWLLNKVTDAFGNYYTITYEEDEINGQYYPVRIDYTGNSVTGLLPYASVRFHYESRGDEIKMYHLGEESRVNKVCSKITTSYEGQLFREYRLYYEYLGPNNYLHLRSVTEYLSETEHLKPVKFEWNTDFEFEITSGHSDYTSKIMGYEALKIPADFNGDNKTDILVYRNAEGISEGEQWTGIRLFYSVSDGNSHSFNEYALPCDLTVKTVNCGDYNGDGKDDILICQDEGYDNHMQNIALFLYQSQTDGSGFQYLNQVSDIIQVEYNNSFNIHSSDFDGDGKTEILIDDGWHSSNVIGSSLKIYEYEGGSINEIASRYSNELHDDDKIEIADFNGDGKTDIIHITQDHSDVYGLQSNDIESLFSTDGLDRNDKHIILDINGDMKKDIVIYEKNNIYQPDLKLLIGNGIDFSYSTTTNPILESSTPIEVIIPGDFNADGKEDFLVGTNADYFYDYIDSSYIPPPPSRIYLANNEGSGFKKIEMNPYIPRCGYPYSVILGDFYGNGETDLLLTSIQSIYEDTIWTDSGEPIVRKTGYELFRGPEKVTDYVVAISNIADNEVQINYTCLNSEEVYTILPYYQHMSSYPNVEVKGAMKVVSSVETYDGISDYNMISYKYAGSLINRMGKGFLGFKYITKTNHATNTVVKTEKFFFPNTLYMYPEYIRKYIDINGSLLLIDETETAQEVNENSFGVITINNSGITRKKRELDGGLISESTTEYVSYDDYGNLTESVITTPGEPNTRIINVYDNDAGNWILGRLTSAQVSNYYDGSPAETRESEFSYYPNGVLEYEIIAPGDPDYEIKTTYEYNDYGNIKKSTVVPYGMESRTAVSTFDNYNRFELTITNSLNHSVTKEYDLISGLVLSETSPNGFETNFTYDKLGRLIHTKLHDGNEASTHYYWASDIGDSPVNASYVTVSEATGTTPATTYYDELGRVIKTKNILFGNKTVYTQSIYNSLGQLVSKSEPYSDEQNIILTTMEYDPLGRLEYVKRTSNWYNNTSKTINYLYQSLSGQTGYKTTVSSITSEDTYQSSKEYDAGGKLIKTIDDEGNEVNFKEYDLFGNLTLIEDPGGNQRSYTYDKYGKLKTETDPARGTIQYNYYPTGQLKTRTDGKGTVINYYDKLGRPVKKEAPGNTVTEWFYDTKPKGIGKLANITGTSNQEFFYDAYGRLSEDIETIDSEIFSTKYSYDQTGRLEYLTYPSSDNFALKYSYDPLTGSLEQISSPDNNDVFWQLGEINDKGQITNSVIGTNHTLIKDYDEYTGWIEGLTCGSVQDFDYLYYTNGNLQSATDNIHSFTESYTFDNLRRLETYSNTATGTITMNYTTYGSITEKSDVGEYQYSPSYNPYSVYSFEHDNLLVESSNHSLTYTWFNKVETIEKPLESIRVKHKFTYGHDLLRRKMTTYINSNPDKTKYYIGDIYEKIVAGDGTTEEIKYIKSPDGLIGVIKSNGSGSETKYVLKDRLNSVYALIDKNDSQNIIYYSFDPWGRRRNMNGNIITAESEYYCSRGYTGHEHLDYFTLINMNGRIYDPVIGQFLSPDPVTQSPGYSQGLNSYAYGFNNPLTFIDPSGYSVIDGAANALSSAGNYIDYFFTTIIPYAFQFGISYATFGTLGPVGSMVTGGFTGGYITTLMQGGDYSQAFENGVNSAQSGLLSGFSSYCVGELFDNVQTFANYKNAINKNTNKISEPYYNYSFEKNLIHGITKGGIALLQGNKFSHGFASGFLSSMSDHITNTLNNDLLKASIAAAVGGTAEAISGGSFANGAVTGAYTYMFNVMTHGNKDKYDIKKLIPVAVSGAIDMDAIFLFIGGECSLTNYALILRGDDQWELASLYDQSDLLRAWGWDLSFSAEIIVWYYTGDIKYFTKDSFRGKRFEAEVGYSVGLDVNVGAVWSKKPDKYGNRIIGVKKSVGGGVSPFWGFSASFNIGETIIKK